ncbi:MAG: kelch repeat-containing protein [Pirellulaceae bacterium]|nr:kelch repeat-containing protein [Pirellulaceae bacterium]
MLRAPRVVCRPHVMAALLVLLSTQVAGGWEPLEGQAASEARASRTKSVCVGSDTTAVDPALDVKSQTVNATELGKSVPELPFGITSFGAAKIGDAIYVYGGHTGTAHHYWNTSQSNQLLRWDTNAADTRWEVVSEGADRLQGLAMVAHGTRLILVGGFFAKNDEGEPHQLFSQDHVSVFDTANNQWSKLPQLPSGRSSHDAIIHEDKLYVVGGWNMSGTESTQWHDSAIMMDLNAATPTWKELPNPGFNRRALALAAFEGKIFAIGGMERDGAPTRKSSVFDPKTQQWSEGPELLGTDGMVGFGAASWPVDGRLITTAYDGSVQVLSTDHKSWVAAGQTDDARFFHRMLPHRPGHLVLIGGSNMESGKFLQPEVIRIESATGVNAR